MTYLEIETSASQAMPLEVYLFRGPDRQWRYTSADAEVVVAGDTYLPVYIERGSIEHSPQAARSDLQITVARDNQLLADLAAGLGEAVTLTLFRGHASDQDFVTIWKGRVISSAFAGATGVLRCESALTSIKRQGLRRKYQCLCPHVLFGAGCGLDAELYAVSGSVAAVAGQVVTVPGLDPFGLSWFAGGFLRFGLYCRTITGQAYDNLELDRALGDLVVGSQVVIYPGCNHYVDDCAGKFGNLINYGGWPYVPTRNPFSGLGSSIL